MIAEIDISKIFFKSKRPAPLPYVVPLKCDADTRFPFQAAAAMMDYLILWGCYHTAVPLDPDTAHRWLILSSGGRSVRMGDRAQDLPDTPQRFDPTGAVLGTERLSSGRHYWEVEVGDTTWWTLGVCDEAVRRKGRSITASPRNGFWIVMLRDGKYKALAGPSAVLTPRVSPRAVGLFLDYEAGRFLVYNVDDRSLLFTFSGASFPPTLRPFFSPHLNEGGGNAGALRVLPVIQE
ncbi:erythroid membrane-associated protein-like [Lissotriton helveticus]